MSAQKAGQHLVASARSVTALAWSTAPWHLAGLGVLMLGEAAAPVAVAWLTKLIIDGIAGPDPLPGGDLTVLAVALAGTGVLMALLPQCRGYLDAEIGRRFEVTATDRLFAAAARLPGLAPFEDPPFLDRLRLAQEGTSLGGGTVTGTFQIGQSVLTLAGFVGSLLLISPPMTAIVLASAVPALAAQLRLSRRRAQMAWDIGPVERRQFFYSRLLGTVDAAKEIRLFDSGDFLRGRMVGLLRDAQTARRGMDRSELVTEGLLATLGAVVAGGGLIWAIGAARAGRLTAGDIALFIAAVAAVQGALSTLVTFVATVHHGLLLHGHHQHVVSAEPGMAVHARPRPLPPLRERIELRDVWFRYSEDHPWVLRGVDLVIPSGGSVALAGLNGAGKSTIVKLLCRFYDPSRGVILWDGIDLRDVRPEELRRRIGGVFQDHMDYDFTAEENIAIADLSALGDAPRIQQAAGAAGIDQTLRGLPRGYRTLLTRMFVSEEDRLDSATGVVLSGGQWQRIALARGFLRNDRDLMILDEPSTGLDAEAEAQIHHQVRRHRAGRTSLLISHRLNALRDADLLVVLQDGVIAERGRHDELMAADGTYARLFRLQSSGYQA